MKRPARARVARAACASVLASLVVLGAWVSPVRAVDDLILSVAPGSEAVQPGDTVTVTLDVANLSVAINGVQALIRYDETILSLVDVVPTTLPLTAPAEGWVEVHFSDSGGDVTYAVVINGDSTSSDGTVATLTFTAVGEGVTSVSFRPDSDPFFTKLTAFDNTTIFPARTDSGSITSSCDDGVFCNGTDQFVGGVCEAGTPPDCSVLTDACNDGVCNEDLDACEAVPANEGGACDDGDPCTTDDTCAGGTCAGVPVDCSSFDDACNVGVCNTSTGACEPEPANEGASCDDGVFCNGDETCAGGECVSSGDPCAPLLCDEGNQTCVSSLRIDTLEVFYAGRYLTCHGGNNDGASCASSADCGGAPCRELADPSRAFLSSGATATTANITNHSRGITGVRVGFNQTATFADTPAAAVSLEWTTGTGTSFSPVDDAATAVTVTTSVENDATLMRIAIAADHVRARWLKISLDASQITSSGVSLDGDLSGNPAALPSGDGAPGGDAVFFVGNMPGDVTSDRRTNLTDVGEIRQRVNPFVSVPITSVFDVDKDRKVTLTDTGRTRQDVNPFLTLPLITP